MCEILNFTEIHSIYRTWYNAVIINSSVLHIGGFGLNSRSEGRLMFFVVFPNVSKYYNLKTAHNCFLSSQIPQN